MIDSDLGRDISFRLLKPFFYLTAVDALGQDVNRIMRFEPRIIELLRLSYWYRLLSISDITSTFSHKRNEIKAKLSKRALRNVEAYETKLEVGNVKNPTEFKKEMKNNLILVKEGKCPDEDFERDMKEIRKTIWAVISELQFAGLCQNAGSIVSFPKSPKGHDYDFAVNGIPSQVKTAVVEHDHAKELFQKIEERIKDRDKGNQVVWEEVVEEIKKLLVSKKSYFNDAIRQGARILFVNGTHAYAGFLANQFSSDKAIQTSLQPMLLTAVHSAQEIGQNDSNQTVKYLPVVFGAAAVDREFRFTAYSLQVPFRNEYDSLQLSEIVMT